MLLIDNGKGFGNPYVDAVDILAPLYQCCVIRRSTFERLQLFTGGMLTVILKNLTTLDNLYPIITDNHYEAMERRLLKIFLVIEKCRQKLGETVLQ